MDVNRYGKNNGDFVSGAGVQGGAQRVCVDLPEEVRALAVFHTGPGSDVLGTWWRPLRIALCRACEEVESLSRGDRGEFIF